MITYTQQADGTLNKVIEGFDGVITIPADPKNVDFQAYQDFLKKGGVTQQVAAPSKQLNTDSIVTTFIKVISAGNIKTLDDLRANPDLVALKANIDAQAATADVAQTVNAGIK